MPDDWQVAGMVDAMLRLSELNLESDVMPGEMFSTPPPAYEAKYISNGLWFDKGTVATLIDDYRPQMNAGLFSGLRDGKLDDEICSFNEFIIHEA